MTEPISTPNIPPQAWSRPLGQGWDHHYIVRYASNLDDGPWHGAPLGGFGAGCMGRSPRGDFNLWHLDGGEHIFQTFPACQFSLFEKPESGEPQAFALCTEAPEDGSLSAWQWYPGGGSQGGREPGSQGTGRYHALYPRSWFTYENVFKAQVTCEQLTPIWADNYQEASYPVAVFEWTAHNPTDQPLTLSLMVTWQNMVGWFTNTQKSPEVQLRDDGSPFYDYVPALGKSAGNYNQVLASDGMKGCLMEGAWHRQRDPQEGDGQWCLATVENPDIEISYDLKWDPTGDGKDVWDYFGRLGRLMNCIRHQSGS
jgi:non-lysosomal glucosylceramidase